MRISDWSSDVCSSDLSAVWRKRMDQDPVLWGAESGGSAQSVLTSRICSTLLQLASRKRSLPNTSASALARETATLMRLSEKIGRESCRERVCQSVSVSVWAGTLKKK